MIKTNGGGSNPLRRKKEREIRSLGNGDEKINVFAEMINCVLKIYVQKIIYVIFKHHLEPNGEEL